VSIYAPSQAVGLQLTVKANGNDGFSAAAAVTRRRIASRRSVTLITDLEGGVLRMICPEFREPGRTCRLKQEAMAGGRLSQLLTRLSEETLGDRGVECQML
jgi:hypothetical protein